MKKFIAFAFITLFLLSLWFHQPWSYIWFNWIGNTNINIPEILNLILSALIAFALVLFVEALRWSEVQFYILDPIFVPVGLADGRKINRKLLKIGVKIKHFRLRKIFNFKIIPSNVHSFATLIIHINHPQKSIYHAKWDIAPEPIEYPHLEQSKIYLKGAYKETQKRQKNFELTGDLNINTLGHPKLEMLSSAMETTNLLPEDVAAASILAKHEGDIDFLIYDPEYYFFRSENRCNKTKVYIKAVFKSSLGRWEAYFQVLNPNSTLPEFKIEKISKQQYDINVDKN